MKISGHATDVVVYVCVCVNMVCMTTLPIMFGHAYVRVVYIIYKTKRELREVNICDTFWNRGARTKYNNIKTYI